jgi:hypothetical protein
MLGSIGTGIEAGFAKPFIAGQQLVGQGVKSAFPKAGKAIISDADLASRKQADFTADANAKHPNFEGAGEFIGNAAAILPAEAAAAGAGAAVVGARLMLAYKAEMPIVRGMVSGALSGLFTPSQEKLQKQLDQSLTDYAKKKAIQTGIGAGAGALSGKIAKGFSRGGGTPAQTASDAAKKTLIDAGVRLTPGQMAGPVARDLEQKATSIPITGIAISQARTQAVHDFNRAAVNQALKPIGATLPKQAQAGHQAIEAAGAILSDVYNEVLPKMNLRLDAAFDRDMSDLIRKAHSGVMPPEQEKQFVKIVQNYVVPRFAPGKLMTGQALKSVESILTRLANSYRSSPLAGDKELGMALGEVRQVFRENLKRQNPAFAPVLQKINRAYAMYKPIQKAAGAATSDGVFTPKQLLMKIRANSPSRDKKAFAEGNALMQPFAMAGDHILGNNVPDSATAGRVALMHLGTVLAGGEVAGQSLAHTAMAVAGLGAAGAAYRAAGPIGRAAARNPELRKLAAKAIGSTAPAAGQAAVGLVQSSGE